MCTAFAAIASVSLFATPSAAANWQEQPSSARPGAFLGARMSLPLGHQTTAKPRAELALAPTTSRISGGGLMRTRIGEGVAFRVSPHSKPTVTLAGLRADRALGLARSARVQPGQKNGLSTVGWVAVGVGTALVVGVVGLALWADHVSDCEERDNGC